MIPVLRPFSADHWRSSLLQTLKTKALKKKKKKKKTEVTVDLDLIIRVLYFSLFTFTCLSSFQNFKVDFRAHCSFFKRSKPEQVYLA
jgi:hypothetical protein